MITESQPFIMAHRDKTMRTISFLYLLVTLSSVSGLSETGNSNNIPSRAYFDEISRVSKLSHQMKYLKSVNIQEELNKLSEVLFRLTNSFSQATENKQSIFLKNNIEDVGDQTEFQKIFLSAVQMLAASSACANDTEKFLTSIIDREAWAVQFLDAFGKPGAGLTTGRLNFVGDYHQCRSSSALSTDGKRRFSGNYCTLKVVMGPASMSGQLSIQIGACLPDSCSASENTKLVTDVIELLNLSSTMQAGPTECHTGHTEMTTATIAALILVIIIGLMLLMGTIYDIIVVQWPMWDASSTENDGFITNGLMSPGHSYTVIGAENPGPNVETMPLLNKAKVDQRGDRTKGICSKVLLAFSVYTNGSKVLNTSQPPGSLGAIHGIRFLSMSWVLLGHIFVFGLGQVANLGSEFQVLLSRWTFDAIANAFVSVDTFFALSGLLTAYLTLTEIRKRGWKINWPLFYFHRFWRLTPPYMLALVFVLGFQQYLGSGALWSSVQPGDKENCEKYWWTNLLYVNNFVSSDKMCFGHSWYLANDMQFFILSPLMIVPFYFHTFLGLASCGIFLLVTWITTGVLSSLNDWPSTLLSLNPQGGDENGNTMVWFQDYYIKPWCRIGPYVIGVLAGSCLAINGGKLNMRWYVAWLGWTIATATGLAAVYGLYGDISGKNASSIELTALYNAVARSAWGASVCWVIIACASGYGGFVNTLLSWSPFVVLGRFTYMAYLIHPSLVAIYFQNQEQLYYINETNIAVTFCGIVVLVNMFAFVLMMALESPWIGLEKVFLHKKRKE